MPKTIAREKRGGTTYKLLDNGELWTTGRYAYRCGYVMNPENLSMAIDSHEEELSVMLTAALAEFA